MTKQTAYIVQAFVAGRGKSLRQEPPILCTSADDACRRAERLSKVRLGVVAFSTSADVEMGDYDDAPIILFKAGEFPPAFDE